MRIHTRNAMKSLSTLESIGVCVEFYNTDSLRLVLTQTYTIIPCIARDEISKAAAIAAAI